MCAASAARMRRGGGLDGGMVLSAVDGGEGRAELRRLCEAHTTGRPYDHLLLTSIADFKRLEAAKLPSSPDSIFPRTSARTGTELFGGHLVGNDTWTQSFLDGGRPRR